MEQNKRDSLSFVYNKEDANLARETAKIDEHFKNKGVTVTPIPGVPQKEVDPNLAAIDDLVNKLNKKSCQRHTITKKKRKLSVNEARKVIAVGIAGAILVTSSPFIVKVVGKTVERIQTANEYNDSIEYMNTYIMPKVCEQAGFSIESIEKKNGATYDYDRENIIKAINILRSDYGFDETEAKLLVYKYLGTDSKFNEITGNDSGYEYFENLGYKNENHLEDLFVSPEKLADRDLMQEINEKVDDIQEMGADSNARS